MSYDETEKQNCSLSLRTIHLSGNENASLPTSVVPGNLEQAAIDSYDHEEEHLHVLVDHMIIFYHVKFRKNITMQKEPIFL